MVTLPCEKSMFKQKKERRPRLVLSKRKTKKTTSYREYFYWYTRKNVINYSKEDFLVHNYK